jgi:hypothetical protein
MTKVLVEYDLENKEIHIPVYLYPPAPGETDLQIVTPPVAVPRGDWHLCWEIDEESLKLAIFHPQGVEKIDPSLTPRATLELLDALGSSCRARVSNPIPVMNSFRANMFLVPPDTNGDPFPPHDPTIAVTQDPLDPPIWGCEDE